MESPAMAISALELPAMQFSPPVNRHLQVRDDVNPPLPDFNYVFLVYLIITAIVAIFFLLYLNRVFGWLISYAIRTYTWHKHRIYIEIQALQISLLGGRIFVSGLRYHAENETFHIQRGYFTWCYWLRNVRNLGLLNTTTHDTEGHDSDSTKALPCRFAANLVGVEWFVYNRTAVYDSILESLLQNMSTEPGVSTSAEINDATSIRRRATHVSGETESDSEKRANRGSSYEDARSPTDMQDRPHTNCGDADESEVPLMLRIFPIHLEVNKAALVMGNENTKAILVVKADDLSGDIDAISTDTPDPYRQVFNMRFKHPVIEMRHNIDYREDQTARATRERKNAQVGEPIPRGNIFIRVIRWWTGSLRNLVPSWQKSTESLSTANHSPIDTANSQTAGVGWQGLSRYLDDQAQDDRARWAHVEYAAEPVVVDSPKATMSIFWDSPAKVPELPDPALRSKEDPYAFNINGEVPPAWGINLTLKGGVVNYGPWADRCRAEIQKVFFPGLCKDAVPAPGLAAGEYRIATQFQLYVQLDENVTVRILTREDSKNWKFKGTVPPISRTTTRKRRDKKESLAEPAAHARQPGWLEFKVAPHSTINYTMDMVAGAQGFITKVDVDFPRTEMSSSVNHQVLLRSGAFRISCDLSTPLQWNSLRTWHFDLFSDNIEFFLLRDHIFLLTDLIDDWGSGPLTEYLIFTPFRYLINFDFRHLKLHLNINDANVIDNAVSTDENMFLILGSPVFTAALEIPIDQFRPAKNVIPFEVRLDPLTIALQLPPWNTQAAFMPSKDIGQAESLVIRGKHEYNAMTAADNTDTLVLDLAIQSPVAKVFGSTIRYLLKLKDNYFGDDLHFRTVQEYQDMLQLKERNPEAETTNRAPFKKTNDMDVMMTVRVDDTKMFLPGNVHSAGKNIQIEAASITSDARFTNYYMDLEFNVSPISLSLGAFQLEGGMSTVSSTATQLFIDGARVFGNRLFGLPPTEPTYLCNWDLSVGALTGECNVDFLAALALGSKAFGFTFDDEENALVSFSSIIYYDITFLRLSFESVKLWIHVDDAAFLVSIDTIDINYNDWARSHYSKKANILMPNLQISCIDTETECHGKNRGFGSIAGVSSKSGGPAPIDADLMFKTTVRLAMIGRKFHFTEERKKQQELVRREDQRTHRAPFLLFPEYAGEYVPDPVDRPAQAVPPIPDPINDGFLSDDCASSIHTGRTGTSLHSGNSAQLSQRSRLTRRTAGGNTLRRQNSFLSFSSAVSSKSVVRPSSSSNEGNRSHMSRSQGHSHTQSIGERWRDAGRRSSSYSEIVEAAGDAQHAGQLSSQFLAPRFPLENVVPQCRDVAEMAQEDDLHAAEYRDFMAAEFPLDEIDPHGLSEEYAYLSFVVEFPTGITGFFNPDSIQHVTKLLGALQPSSPDDMLDSLHLSSMTTVLDLKKDAAISGTILDLMVCLPSAHIRFLNTSSLDSPEPLLDEQDQYDVQLSKLAVIMRNTKSWDDIFCAETHIARTSFRASCGSMIFSASERLQDGGETQAAVQAHVVGATVSMGSRDVISVDAEVENITCSTSSAKIQYMASLIHRTGVLAQTISNTLDDALGNQRDRMQVFVHQLLAHGQHIPDPAFIVRPSAILRSVPGHLRVHDSWKMIQRLRQIWSKMTPLDRDELLTVCLETRPRPVPDDVQEQVVAMFSKWRGWDLEALSQSVLLKDIFGASDGQPFAKADDLPLLVTCRLGEVEMVLDPGPKQNRVALMGLTAKVKANDARETSNIGIDGIQEPMTVVNLHCREALAKINWELCELADDVLELYTSTTTAKDKVVETPVASPRTGASVATAKKKSEREAEAFHVVLAIGKSSIDIDTINLHSKTHCSGLNGSALIHTLPAGVTSANLILSADAVASSLYSHSQKLGIFQLQESSLFLSHENKEEATKDSHVIKCAPSSKSLRIKIKQDPLALLEVADLLIRDEFAQLYKLKSSLPVANAQKTRRPVTAGSGSQPSKKIVDRLSTIKINVAMFFNDYDITVPLTQNLTYNIAGVVARAAVATNFGKELIFDFDIKENSHSISVGSGSGIREISLLQIPPMNGRVRSVIGPSEHKISVATSLEMVQLDASAVYSLLMALNRPQLAAEIQDVKEMVDVLEEHFKHVVGPEVPIEAAETEIVKAETPSVPMVYRVHLALAGLHVFGKTSLTSDPDPLAYIAFSLEKVHFEATNHLGPGQPVLETPHMNVNLSHIAFDIRKGHEQAMRSCGSLAFSALLSLTSMPVAGSFEEERALSFQTNGLEIMLSPETVSTAIDIMGHMGDKIRDLDTSRERQYLRKLRQSKPRIAINDAELDGVPEVDLFDSVLGSFVYHFEIRNITVCWLVSGALEETEGQEDLVLTVELIGLSTRKSKSARLEIQNLQLQMVPIDEVKTAARSHHSALLPEIVFNVASFSSGSTRRMAFQAVGKSVEVKLTSGFMIPATHLQESITRSAANIQKATENWTIPTTTIIPETPVSATSVTSTASSSSEKPLASPGVFGRKRFESLLIHADFAGAMLHLSGRRSPVASGTAKGKGRSNASGKYGQFKTDDSNISASLRSPGLAWRMEYRDNGTDRPALNGEVKVEGSSNTLHPTVVPLIMDISSSFKEIVAANKKKPGASAAEKEAKVVRQKEKEKEKEKQKQRQKQRQKQKQKKPRVSESTSWLGNVVVDKDKDSKDDDTVLLVSDPSLVLGKLNLNLGLRIAQQQFTLSCQPIARVAASGSFAGIYTTINTVHSVELGNLLAITATCSKLQASVQHVYSRESTASFEVDSIVLSLMNNKHFSGSTGVSALLKVSPMVVVLNARQMQDFLLFGEIWYPKEMRSSATDDDTSSTSDSNSPAAPAPPALNTEGTTMSQQAHLVARYQQVAATAAFPWTATISIQALDVNLDMGQAVGKSVFEIKDFWVSSRKTSDWEQNLCLGFERIGMTSTGRMSGFVALRDFKVRTSIQWPMRERALSATPLIQASVAFSQFRLKVSWDYQAFLVADITQLDFLMYNVRRKGGDRLVAILDGEAVQAFGTTGSVAQGVGLWKAIGKFLQERRAALKTSLGDIEQFSRRRTVSGAFSVTTVNLRTDKRNDILDGRDTEDVSKAPISLDTDVVVTLKAVNLGVFPSSFTDHQVFKVEALNAQARFAANIVEGPRLHSILDLTLGQLRVGLAGVRSERSAASDLSVEEVVARSTGARGGTILKVPRVHAMMETWQPTGAQGSGRTIDYIFSSAFEGKVEVGWNYSRISYIRGMWASHVQSLEGVGFGSGNQGIVMPLKVTGVPGPASPDSCANNGEATTEKTSKEEEERKITAEVNMPVSKYEYRPLRDPIIQTPQLKDMGEATPPLEWIGLHRDRLPNLTHQIVIVTLLELAGEVEDAYSKILGSS